ncbi:unnamed protein product [Cylicostephanus goldi]|uniref:Uncharacterized protein n=1 Tax=Cylicostephanus goldi TaxID=71465 RepID=A0A3P6RUX4_CYLGO|nr:unnamed protein product [Cylicostephanus goldi]
MYGIQITCLEATAQRLKLLPNCTAMTINFSANPQFLGLGDLLASAVGAAQVGARVTGQILSSVGVGLNSAGAAIVDNYMMFGPENSQNQNGGVVQQN